MAMNRPEKKFWGKDKNSKTTKFITSLKVGDTVMVLTGGNAKKQRVLKGQIGKISKFLPKRNRVIVEGVNIMKRHQRAKSMNEPAGIRQIEGSIAISNVMYYVEALKRPVRLKSTTLDSGKRVRAYIDPKSKKLVPIDA